MVKEYFKDISKNLMFIEDKDDSKKRHDFESLTYTKDITSGDIKTGLESLRN